MTILENVSVFCELMDCFRDNLDEGTKTCILPELERLFPWRHVQWDSDNVERFGQFLNQQKSQFLHEREFVSLRDKYTRET